jgi:hypothetical protein
MKINELISNFEIWTTNEESNLLKKLKTPVKLAHFNEHDQLKIQNMIHKSLVKKIGHTNPTVVINEKY